MTIAVPRWGFLYQLFSKGNTKVDDFHLGMLWKSIGQTSLKPLNRVSNMKNSLA